MRKYSEILTTGSLPVFHLRRIWEKTQNKLDGNTLPDLLPNESELDRVVLDSIGLGIVEPFQFLFQKRPTFQEFEAWITETLASPLPPETVEKTNHFVERFLEGNPASFPCSGNHRKHQSFGNKIPRWENHQFSLSRKNRGPGIQ